MIKIIKQDTKQIADCNTCSCKFSYENEDILMSKAQPCVYFRPYSYVKCPQCSSEVIVKEVKFV